MVRAAPPEHFRFLEERASCVLSRDARAIEAVDGERILGMVAYDRWTENAVCIHVALEEPIAARALLGPALAYPFDEAGKSLVWGLVRGKNTRSLRLARHLGMREAHRIRDGWAVGEDLVLFELRREEVARGRAA